MQLKPAPGRGVLQPGLLLGRCALQLEQEWPVDRLDIDAAILHRLERLGEF
jgi:hypothetical protein